MVKPTTIHVVLITLDRNWEIKQLDTNNALLNGIPQELYLWINLQGLNNMINRNF